MGGNAYAAMIRTPKTCGPWTTVAQAAAAFSRDDHVDALLVVENRRLLAVVDRGDLAYAPPRGYARYFGQIHGRVIRPHADLDDAYVTLVRTARRRLAVVDENGELLGLLCLKRSGLGFCSDADVQARADSRRSRSRLPSVSEITSERPVGLSFDTVLGSG